MKLRISFIALLLTLALLPCIFAGCNTTPSDTETDTSDHAPDTETTTDASIDQTTQEELPPITIEQTNDSATVKLSSGLSYTASGYDSVGNDTFCFDNGLILDLGDQFRANFNRFTIKYVASAPMKMTITYTEKEKIFEDVFYLEAGEQEFRALNHKFFMKVKGSDLTTIRIDTCRGESADFILHDLVTESISVPDSQQYLTGVRYTLGVDLKWGGTINILEDTQCPIEKVTNLCNMHDE